MIIIQIFITIIFGCISSALAPNGNFYILLLKGITLGIFSYMLSSEIYTYYKCRISIIDYIKNNKPEIINLIAGALLFLTTTIGLDYIAKTIIFTNNLFLNVFIVTALYVLFFFSLFKFYKQTSLFQVRNQRITNAYSEIWVHCISSSLVVFVVANSTHDNTALVWIFAIFQLIPLVIFAFACSERNNFTPGNQFSYSESDIEKAAFHESGHCILYCMFDDVPDWFYSRVNFIKDNRVKLGETARMRYYGGVTTHKDAVFDMLMLVGGAIAETAQTKELTNGNLIDVEAWQLIARKYLISSQRFHYYASPVTQFEQNTNDSSIKKLYSLHNLIMKEVVTANFTTISEIANILRLNHEILSCDINKFKSSFVVPKTLKTELDKLAPQSILT